MGSPDKHSHRPLADRFKRFLDQYAQAETIDDLTLTADQRAAKRADYFLNRRSVIAELKEAAADVGPRMEQALAPWMKRPDWPIFFGTANLMPYLARHPHGEEIKRALHLAGSAVFTERFESANRQIRSTQQTFQLPEADGLLIYLNDVTEALAPPIVAYCISRLFGKRTPDGAARYPHVDAVVYVGETHLIRVSGYNVPGIFTAFRDSSRLSLLKTCEDLARAWATFQGLPLIPTDIGAIAGLDERTIARTKVEARPRAPRNLTEAWLAQYRTDPCLRDLTDDRLMQLGTEVFARLAAGFLKVSDNKLTPEQALPWTQLFSHFMEELKNRGLGLQALTQDRRAEVDKRINELAGREVTGQGGSPSMPGPPVA